MKLNMKSVQICLIAFVIFGMATQLAYAWDWPSSDDLDDWWDDTTDEAEDWLDDAKDWWDDTTDEAEDWLDDKKEEAEDWWEDTKDKAEETNVKMQELFDEFQGTIEKNWDRAIEIANQLADSPYAAEAWDEVSKKKERLLCEKYSDPEKVDELERRRGLVIEGTILAVKLIPVYDPEKKQVRTFSGFARDIVSGNPDLEGSDLAKDPVRCATLMLLDSDYLEYAKIIQTSDGRWISMKEARATGYMTTEVNVANSDYLAAKNAYACGDSEHVEKHFASFSSRIRAINEGSNSNRQLWLLPIGVVAIIGVVSIGLLVKRNARKQETVA